MLIIVINLIMSFTRRLKIRSIERHSQRDAIQLVAFRSDETWMPASVPAAGASWITGIAIDRDGRTWAVGSSFPSNAVVTGLVVSGCVES